MSLKEHPLNKYNQNMSTSLVLCGGGVYGAILLGALEKKAYENIRMIAGTSAGAVIGTLMCVGYTPRDILVHFQANLPMLCDVDLKLLFTKYGLYDKRKYLRVVENMIHQQMKEYPTFKDVYDVFGKDLIITGTNLSKGVGLYFNRIDHPDMKVMDAIEISTCVPLVFPYATLGGDVCVDGAVTDGLPIHFAKEYAKTHVHDTPPPTLEVFDIQYAFGLSPDTLSSFVICMFALFANQQRDKHHDPQHTYTLFADTLVPLTLSDPSVLQTLFDSGYAQCA
jgi:predicted acylesterase/phospholipase RssA